MSTKTPDDDNTNRHAPVTPYKPTPDDRLNGREKVRSFPLSHDEAMQNRYHALMQGHLCIICQRPPTRTTPIERGMHASCRASFEAGFHAHLVRAIDDQS